jgi:hypothetical protein
MLRTIYSALCQNREIPQEFIAAGPIVIMKIAFMVRRADIIMGKVIPM